MAASTWMCHPGILDHDVSGQDSFRTYGPRTETSNDVFSDIVLDSDVEGRQFWRTLGSSRTSREHQQFCEKSFTGKALNLATIHHRLRQSLRKFFLTEEYNFFHVMNEENVLQISSAMYFKLYYF